MVDNQIFTLHRICQIEREQDALVLCALRFENAEEAQDLEDELAFLDDEEAFSKGFSFDDVTQSKLDTYKTAVDKLTASTAQLSCTYQKLDNFPKTGSCVTLYQMYRSVTLPWRSAGKHTVLMVEDGFNDEPCLGNGCKFVYVGGSDCESKLGVPVDDDQTHLRIDDLRTSLERTMSPLSKLEVVQQRTGEYARIYRLLELCDRAIAYDWSSERGSAAKSEISNAVFAIGRERLILKDETNGRKIPAGRSRHHG